MTLMGDVRGFHTVAQALRHITERATIEPGNLRVRAAGTNDLWTPEVFGEECMQSRQHVEIAASVTWLLEPVRDALGLRVGDLTISGIHHALYDVSPGIPLEKEEEMDAAAADAEIARAAEEGAADYAETPDPLASASASASESASASRRAAATSGIIEGRIVHYVAYNGRHLAAIITGHDGNDSGELTPMTSTVDLVVFTNMRNVNGTQSGGVQSHFTVPYSEKLAPGTWHWPERV